MSQLDLALVANISSRHISFLENGRANASEEMLLRVMCALEVPLRDQNHVLAAASFPPRYLEVRLDEIDTAVDSAIQQMMRGHEPYPLTVMNACYDIVRSNRTAENIFSQFVAQTERLNLPVNLFDLVFDPSMARPFISNWSQLGQQMVYRLHREALLHHKDHELWGLLDRVLAYPDVPCAWRLPDFSITQAPINSLILKNDTLELGFFMVATRFLDSQQITLDELRIESYFPIDHATRLACEALADSAAQSDAVLEIITRYE